MLFENIQHYVSVCGGGGGFVTKQDLRDLEYICGNLVHDEAKTNSKFDFYSLVDIIGHVKLRGVTNFDPTDGDSSMIILIDRSFTGTYHQKIWFATSEEITEFLASLVRALENMPIILPRLIRSTVESFTLLVTHLNPLTVESKYMKIWETVLSRRTYPRTAEIIVNVLLKLHACQKLNHTGTLFSLEFSQNPPF